MRNCIWAALKTYRYSSTEHRLDLSCRVSASVDVPWICSTEREMSCGITSEILTLLASVEANVRGGMVTRWRVNMRVRQENGRRSRRDNTM